ncbi:MAG TPA: putative lipid II flippase FtsW [Candidatus Gastranaerophilales bacterium]|nr:putative lipid II flippase FtsW [Candidatus Gastranaerophilales bacterium]
MSSIKRRRLARLARDERRVIRSLNPKAVMLGPPDSILVIIICSLVIFGIMAVFSAGAPEGAELYGNIAYFLIRHLIAVVIGLVCLIVAFNTNYNFWKKSVIPITYIIIALIVATLIPGMGKTIYGSSRWLAGIPIQPSEFCKFATIILVSSAIVESKNFFDSKMIKHLFLIGVMIVVLLLQPNLSNALILCFITATLMIIGGVSFRFLLSLATMALLAIMTSIHSYQIDRVKGWLDPWADPQGTGYNLIQSYYAIGSGGIFGLGYGNSRQKLFWLPFSHTDFIFAVIAEELGLIGCLALLGLFLAFLHRGFYIANKCSDPFGKLFAFGITFAIIVQAFINIGVAVGTLPVTGVTLPLISHGGTSVVLTLFMTGILLNISRKRIRRLHTQRIRE